MFEDIMLPLLPQDQIEKVFGQDECDIDYQFLGFTYVYKALSLIIPKHFTVVDLGCAYNPQCFYFTEHKRYVAVDQGNMVRFQAPNCDLYTMTIQEFIEKHLHEFDLKETFAICSYVPDWYGENRKAVREAFENVFTYYPHGNPDVILARRNTE